MPSPIYRVSLSILLSIVLTSYFSQKKISTPARIDAFFKQKLDSFQKELHSFRQHSALKKAPSELQKSYKRLRKAYKELAVLTDYFNPYESKQLNGAALKKIEEDNPQTIIEPHGLQVLEELVYAKTVTYNLIDYEVAFIENIITRLINEPDRKLKFEDAKVWQALRMAIIRTTTLSITGFDSPIAQNGIEETKASLATINEIAALYGHVVPAEQLVELKKVIDRSLIHINHVKSIASFDHLSFIKDHLNPISRLISSIRLRQQWTTNERLPLKEDALTIFDDAAFNIDFFSPNERYKPTPERVLLGEKLFYDPILSATKKQSCGTCHQPEKAFTDGRPKALSINGKDFLLRNTPTLLNSVFQTRQFYDSRALTLETQLSDVVHNSDEMGGSLQQSVDDLSKNNLYKQLFTKAYSADKDPVSAYNIANAISSYVRSRVALSSRFDQYMRGDHNALSEDEKKGFNLFAGKAKCATCHFIPLTNGLVPPDFNETESEVLGVPANKRKRTSLDTDEGKYRHTSAIVHRYAFKTPTLRNVSLTAPYMHNGVFNTLEEVMEFYNQGGGAGLGIAPDTQTLPADKLKLSSKEKKQIIAFLKSLTDTTVSFTIK